MKLTYDPEHNIAYLRLHEKREQVDTIRVSEELNVDIAPDGTVYGIELLNANVQIQAEDGGGFVVVDEGAGRMQQLPLAVHEPATVYRIPRKRKKQSRLGVLRWVRRPPKRRRGTPYLDPPRRAGELRQHWAIGSAMSIDRYRHNHGLFDGAYFRRFVGDPSLPGGWALPADAAETGPCPAAASAR